jgi:hypothetical protein
MLFFDVVLPTLDVYSDLSLVVPWYLDGHPKYALMMTIPPLLNLGFTSYKWWSSEKSSEKKWSWLLVILQFYSQFKALQVINLLWKKDPKAHEKKKEMLKEVSSLEPFLESTPSTLIMTMIWFLAAYGENGFGPEMTGIPIPVPIPRDYGIPIPISRSGLEVPKKRDPEKNPDSGSGFTGNDENWVCGVKGAAKFFGCFLNR